MTLGTAPVATSGSRRRRLVGPGLLGAGVLAATAYTWAVDPYEPGHYPVCPTYALAGIYCPGCGMLRATHDLLHGDLAGALARNPLSPLVLVAIAALLVVWTRSRWRGSTTTWVPPRWLPWALVTSFVLFTAARNVPGWTWLSPA